MRIGRGLVMVGAAAGLFTAYAGRAGAVDTSTWETRGPNGLTATETEKVSVTAQGIAELAPQLESAIAPGESYVWSIAAAANGDAYAGTGDGGLVLRLPRSGKADTLRDTVELEIMAVAVGPDGAVYAGGSPDGVIIRIKDGKAETFFDSPESYIWGLAFAPNGDLYAATGDRGRLYRVSKSGEGEVYYDSNEVHLLALLPAGDGRFVVGTAGSGLVLEITGKDKARVLYDAAEEEIKALVRDPAGNLYFAAAGGGNGGGGGGMLSGDEDEAPEANQSTEVIEVTPARPSGRGGGGGPGGEREAARGPRAVVYRQSPAGATIRFWRAPEKMINALAWEEPGNLFVGTGDKGAIYRLDARGTATRIVETEESQVLALCRAGSGILIGTANPGKVYRFGPGVEPSGTLTSKAFDAGNVAAWGRLGFAGTTPPGTEIELRTRTGNTEKPDETWSVWSDAIQEPSGTTITSPTARFIQWQATLAGRGNATPRLSAVTVAYRQENLPPRLQAVDVNEPGEPIVPGSADSGPDRVSVILPNGLQAEFSRPAAGPRPVRPDQVPWLRDVKVANWLAEDPNGDKLAFDLFVRGEQENRWRPIAEEVPDQAHAFPTATFADGRYQLRVVATDRPSNPEAGALVDSLDSTLFLVDNTAPAITSLRVQRASEHRLAVSATVEDELSRVRSFEYSVDARDWNPVFPIDGIFDDQEEEFRFEINLLAVREAAQQRSARTGQAIDSAGGGETVFVRAADGAGNQGASRAVAP
jgi:WD40 repeat protein